MPVAVDVAVVVGASGGIGGALVRALRQDPRFAHVAALSRRRPAGWADEKDATWLGVDVLDAEELARAADRVAELGVPTRIIVATGLLHGPGITPEKSLRALEPAAIIPFKKAG